MDKSAYSYLRFLSGDENAFADIVKESRTGLTYFINSIVRNVDAAEELTEDVFVKLYLKRPKDRKNCSFKTWLYTIARNMALDYLRKTKREALLSADVSEDSHRQEDLLEEKYIAEETKRALEKALKSINPDYAAALRLTFYEGFSSEETAHILKKSVKSTYDLIYRAKKSLKEQLIKDGFTYEIR